jgi:hypothetical protein
MCPEESCAIVAKIFQSHFQIDKTRLSAESHQSNLVFVRGSQLEMLASFSHLPSFLELFVPNSPQFPIVAMNQ